MGIDCLKYEKNGMTDRCIGKATMKDGQPRGLAVKVWIFSLDQENAVDD